VKVAVTGATGFVGRHVVEELERRAISAVLLCRPETELPPNFLTHTVVRFDLRELPENALSMLGKPDVLIHLAWGGLPNYKSLHHFEEELPAHYRFLKQLIEAGLGKLVVAGTCFEYGMKSGPLREDLETRPENPYGFAKDSLRRQLEFLQSQSPFYLTWARMFYLYGDGQAEGSLLPQLKRAVKVGDPVFKMSGGEQLRDYLPVIDAAKYLVSLAMNGSDNGVLNVCSGTPVSVRKLVQDWIRENDWTLDLDLGYYPYPGYEPMAFWGDREKLDRCLRPR
jgi:dTDP-6-deoxy-L-talose 4-dehydrogenase (NAD+)